MDALPMAAVALSWSGSPKLPRMAAWLVVLLVHGGLSLWLLDSGRIELRSDDGPRILLRWLPPELPTPVAKQPTLPSAQMTRPAASVMPRPAQVAQADSAQPAAEDAAAVAPLILSLPTGSIDGGDGISAALEPSRARLHLAKNSRPWLDATKSKQQPSVGSARRKALGGRVVTTGSRWP